MFAHKSNLESMEPLKGGRLAPPVPESIQRLWDSHAVQRSPVEWALRFVWDDARVASLLSGMSTMDQVVVNTALAEAGEAGSLTAADRALIGKVRKAYRDRTVVDCTACRYCLPCPQGIDLHAGERFSGHISTFGMVNGEQCSRSGVARPGCSTPSSGSEQRLSHASLRRRRRSQCLGRVALSVPA